MILSFKQKAIYLLYIMVLFSSLSGCKSSGYEYTLVVENMRSHGWTDFLIQSSDGLKIPFAVNAGTWKTYNASFSSPPNAVYLVSWVNEKGNEYYANVDLRNRMQKNFNGYIYFTLDEQNVLNYSASRVYRGPKMFEVPVEGGKK